MYIHDPLRHLCDGSILRYSVSQAKLCRIRLPHKLAIKATRYDLTVVNHWSPGTSVRGSTKFKNCRKLDRYENREIPNHIFEIKVKMSLNKLSETHIYLFKFISVPCQRKRMVWQRTNQTSLIPHPQILTATCRSVSRVLQSLNYKVTNTTVDGEALSLWRAINFSSVRSPEQKRGSPVTSMGFPLSYKA